MILRRLIELLRDLPEADCSAHEAMMRLAGRRVLRPLKPKATALPRVKTNGAARVQSIRRAS